MVIHLVLDPDTRNQTSKLFNTDYGIEEIRWEEFPDGAVRKFAQQDAYVGDSIYPALFLNTLTVKPHMISVLPDGRVYVSVETL